MFSSFVMGLFCEDVRDETTGTQTIVGIFPDNVAIPSVPASVPKLALYLRFMLDPASDPGPISVSLNFPDGQVKELLTVDAEATKAACKAARESGVPIAGIISKVLMLQFQVLKAGRVIAMATVGGEERVCATVNFQLVPTSSSAPVPPSGQSSDAPKLKGTSP